MGVLSHQLIVIITVASSSLLSLFCTSLVLIHSLTHSFAHRRRSSLDTGEMISRQGTPSPGPPNNRQRSKSIFSWPSITDRAVKDRTTCPLTLLQAGLDHISQLIVLLVLVVTLLQPNTGNTINILHHKAALFSCAFALSLRFLLPLAATLFKVSIRLMHRSNGTVMVVVGIPVLVCALIVAGGSVLGSGHPQSPAASILLLSFIGLCLLISSFLSCRLAHIQRIGRKKAKCPPREGKRPRTGNERANTHLPSTMTSAGTKASSANPYDGKSHALIAKAVNASTALLEEDLDPHISYSQANLHLPLPAAEVPKSYFSPATIENDDSLEMSSLWLDQSFSVQDEGDVHCPGVSDIQDRRPPSKHSENDSLADRQVASASPISDIRSGARLRLYPSARELMSSLSSSQSHYELALSVDIGSVLIGLASMWLISTLCMPLLVTTLLNGESSSSPSLALTICFIVAIASSGPLLAWQTLRKEMPFPQLVSLLHSMRNIETPVPRPSFTTNPLDGRRSSLSDNITYTENPVAGDGFEPINGYDNPFLLPQFPGAYRSTEKVKSVPYYKRHWIAGKVKGDRIVTTQRLFGRAANMMSPKPRLQVQLNQEQSHDVIDNPSDDIIDIDDTLSSGANESDHDRSTSGLLPPGAMPTSPRAEDLTMASLSLSNPRRINTIYEVDTLDGSNDTSARDRSYGMSSNGIEISRRMSVISELATTALRRRRASASESDCLSIKNKEVKMTARDPGRPFSTESSNIQLHRNSMSMSVVDHKSIWSPVPLEMESIPDVSISSDVLMNRRDSSPASATVAEQSDLSGVAEEERKADVAAEKVVCVDASTQHGSCRNWSLVEESPQSPLKAAKLYSNRTTSTPPRAQQRSISSATRSSGGLMRKRLGMEMGFPEADPMQDSPCRSSSDLSSLFKRRETMDTISESLISSGVSEELLLSPDGTPNATLDRINRLQGQIEREIVIIEMEESACQLSRGEEESNSLPVASALVSEGEEGEQGKEVMTTPHERREGNWLDPIEELTEEPTVSGNDTPGAKSCSSAASTKKTTELVKQVSKQQSPIRGDEEWTRLHGLATPSSLALSPTSSLRSHSHSRFGWAEVIKTTRQASHPFHQKCHPSPRSPSSFSRHSRMESDLSAHARAYRANKIGTPSRLIGLNSSFWIHSPPSLSLSAQAILQERKQRGANQDIKTLNAAIERRGSPASLLCFREDAESSWVDGALEENEEEQARQDVARNEKKWRRKSKGMSILDASSKDIIPSKAKTIKRRSTASLQSLLGAAVRRSSNTLKMSQQEKDAYTRESVASSNSGTLICTPPRLLTSIVPAIHVTEADNNSRYCNANDSDVKVDGSGSLPSTPKRRSSGTAILSPKYSSSPKRRSSPNSHSITKRIPPRKSSAVRHKVHQRQDSIVREKIKLLETAVKAAMEEKYSAFREQSTGQSRPLSSPTKKVAHPRIIVRGSPGKFRLQEAIDAAADRAAGYPTLMTNSPWEEDDDKENALLPDPPPETRGMEKRSRRYPRQTLFDTQQYQENNPQIYVRPPSGSSIRSQLLF